jgi:hypothetical protein
MIWDLPNGVIIILALRILIPLTIFRWPLWGGIASLLIDAYDCQIASFLGCYIPNYILSDKFLDTYYLTIELIVSQGWHNQFAKKTALALYIWRLFGVLLFQVTASEKWLVVAPNVFEMFFLFFAFLQFLGKETKGKFWLSGTKKLSLVLVIMLLFKIPQEIVLHFWKEPLEIFYQWLGSLI